jgi:hypothetical protein
MPGSAVADLPLDAAFDTFVLGRAGTVAGATPQRLSSPSSRLVQLDLRVPPAHEDAAVSRHHCELVRHLEDGDNGGGSGGSFTLRCTGATGVGLVRRHGGKEARVLLPKGAEARLHRGDRIVLDGYKTTADAGSLLVFALVAWPADGASLMGAAAEDTAAATATPATTATTAAAAAATATAAGALVGLGAYAHPGKALAGGPGGWRRALHNLVARPQDARPQIYYEVLCAREWAFALGACVRA